MPRTQGLPFTQASGQLATGIVNIAGVSIQNTGANIVTVTAFDDTGSGGLLLFAFVLAVVNTVGSTVDQQYPLGRYANKGIRLVFAGTTPALTGTVWDM